MSRTGVGVRVMVDGAQLDDGCIDYTTPPSRPQVGAGLTADAGLKIVWGRSTTIDQPNPSSCTFRVVDTPGGVTYVSTLYVGASVEVFADAAVSGDATVNTFTGGDFEAAVNGTPSNAKLTRSTKVASEGAASARLDPVNTARQWGASFAPAALQAPGTNPAAWDTIPSTSPGQTWTIELEIYAPAGVSGRVAPVLYSGPYAHAATVLSPQAVAYAGSGAWQHVTLTFAPGGVGGAWVGVAVEAQGAGLKWDQVAPGLTWDTVAASVAWDDFGAVHVDDVKVYAPPPAATSTILVFSGRVTDLEASFDEAANAPAIEVTASDYLAELANRDIGSEPWLAEPVVDRVGRILSLASMPGEPPLTADIAPTLADVIMSWHDVDRQPAAGLLTDIAQSVDGVLWSATHIATGPYLKLEDPGERAALYTLIMIGGVVVIAPIDFSADPDHAPLQLSACDMLRDPVRFALDVGDVATRAGIEWLEQGVDGDGNTTTSGVTELVVDTDREARVGSRAISVSTLLTTAPQAFETGARILSRLDGEYRAIGITIADADFAVPDAEAARAQLRLLSGVDRGGLPVEITDMPAWNPIGDPLPGYVEGGEYTFDGGGWSLGLIVSRATGLGKSATWDELDPSWSWDEFDPAVTWNDLRGVAMTPELGRV